MMRFTIFYFRLAIGDLRSAILDFGIAGAVPA